MSHPDPTEGGKYRVSFNCRGCFKKGASTKVKDPRQCPKCWRETHQDSLDDIIGAIPQPKNQPKRGTVYILQPEGFNFVKIGYTRGDVMARLLALEAGCPFRLQIACWFAGDAITERSLHKHFQKHHLRREWFHLVPEIADFVSRVNVVTAGIAA